MDFQSSVEAIDEITKKVVVVVAQGRVSKEYKTTVKQVGRTAEIPGFRRGKVPLDRVERLMGDRIKFDIAHRLINEGLEEAFKKFELNPVSTPQVDPKEIQIHSDFEFTATVEILPEPTVVGYFDRTVEVERAEIGDNDVTKEIERLCEAQSKLTPIEDRKVIQLGDVVALNTSTRIEDGEFSRPEPFVDEVGAGRLSKQVEEKLVGLEVDSDKEVELEITADDAHPIESMRGKKVTYKLVIQGIYAKELPNLDEEFVKSLEMDVDNLGQLREKLKVQLTERANAEAKNAAQSNLLDLLEKEHDFKVPQALVDREIRNVLYRMRMISADVDPSRIDVAKFRPYFNDSALKRVKTTILIDRIGTQEGVTVEDGDREAMLEQIAKENGSTRDAISKILLRENSREGFDSEVRRTKILDLLMSRNKVQYSHKAIAA